MRIAILSDVHGFDLALETVLEDIERRGPFAEVIVAGDLCEVGPAPQGVLALLESRDITLLCGNTDRDLVVAAAGGQRDAQQDFALRQIGPSGVARLAALPFQRRVTPPGGGSPRDDLLAVHANPHDLTAKLTPEMSDAELRDVLGDVRAAVIAFGHHHVAFTRDIDDIQLVDVSAVGNPKDGDLRCKYGIFTWDHGQMRWTVEIVRLEYPLEATIAQIRQSGMPGPERAIRRLLKASYDE